jgi:hypothetical protein
MLTPLSRRRFLASLAGALPVAVFVRHAHAAAVAHLQSDPATLDALAEVVLPSAALGKTGFAKEVESFRKWGAEYREGAEVNHGYGTSRLRTLGPTPMTRWSAQLDDLDAQAKAKHQKAFHQVPVADRADLVRAALQGQRLDRLPGVADASHVALALLSHFYNSSAANDLCYEAQIGQQTCRPLAQQARKPLPMMKLSER